VSITHAKLTVVRPELIDRTGLTQLFIAGVCWANAVHEAGHASKKQTACC